MLSPPSIIHCTCNICDWEGDISASVNNIELQCPKCSLFEVSEIFYNLSACPFCNQRRVVIHGGVLAGDAVWVACCFCFARGPHGTDEDHAKALWNMRAEE